MKSINTIRKIAGILFIVSAIAAILSLFAAVNTAILAVEAFRYAGTALINSLMLGSLSGAVVFALKEKKEE